MDKKYLINKSKYISLLLRHTPEKANLTLDKKGYVKVSDLLKAVGITKAELEEVVATNDKQRFAFDEDRGYHTFIRASQGHSKPVDLGYAEKEPPEVLYHGTSTNKKDLIFKDGLKKMKRQHVHLSLLHGTALNVGKRHGTPFIFSVDAVQMCKDGFKFYLSDNNVWLTDNVPPKYLFVV